MTDTIPPTTVKREINVIGTACPLNFVKVKLTLEAMNPGDILKVVLDPGEPVFNVKASIEQEGHQLLWEEMQEKCGIIWIKKV